MDDGSVIVGEIVQADFHPEDYSDAITVTVKCSTDTRVGHRRVLIVDEKHKDVVLRALGRIPPLPCEICGSTTSDHDGNAHDSFQRALDYERSQR